MTNDSHDKGSSVNNNIMENAKAKGIMMNRISQEEFDQEMDEMKG